MFSPTRTALYEAISAMALAANEANAGCKVISGSYICAAWITGSEICNVKFGGLPNETGDTITCDVFGDSTFNGQFCITGQLPPGTLVCGPPPILGAPQITTTVNTASTTNTHDKHFCKHDGKVVGHSDGNCDPADIPGILFLSGSAIATCDAQGTCTASATVNPPSGSLCDNGGPVLNFTADHFLGEVTARSAAFSGFDGAEGHLWQQCQRVNDQYSCQDLNYTPNNCPST